MKKITVLLIIVMVMIFSLNALALKKSKNTHKEFSGIKRIEIESLSGDIFIKKGSSDKIIVEIEASIKPEGVFEPDFIESGNVLKITEKRHGSTSGSLIWHLTVPEKTDAIHARTTSGNVVIENFTGKLDIGSVSGNIKAKNITLEEESSFSTVAGGVKISLGETAKYDISLFSATGKVTLDYNGNPLQGHFQFIARENRGRIKSPVKFNEESSFSIELDENDNEFYKFDRDQDYMKKSFSKGGNSPRIFLNTVTGKAILKK